MKVLFYSIVLLIITGCGKYVSPEPGESFARLIVKENVFVDTQLDKVNYILNVDSKFVEPNQDVSLSVGNHNIKVLIAVFNNEKIKRVTFNDINLKVNQNDEYIITITTNKKQFVVGDNSIAIATISNRGKVETIKKVKLEDADIKKERESGEVVQQAIIYSAVQAAGL